MQQFSASTSPMGFMVNMLPARTWPYTLVQSDQFLELIIIVKFIPEWAPGSHFKKIAKEWAAHLEETVEQPFEWVKTGMVCIVKPSYRCPFGNIFCLL